jgi:hypothetical protein
VYNFSIADRLEINIHLPRADLTTVPLSSQLIMSKIARLAASVSVAASRDSRTIKRHLPTRWHS